MLAKFSVILVFLSFSADASIVDKLRDLCSGKWRQLAGEAEITAGSQKFSDLTPTRKTTEGEVLFDITDTFPDFMQTAGYSLSKEGTDKVINYPSGVDFSANHAAANAAWPPDLALVKLRPVGKNEGSIEHLDIAKALVNNEIPVSINGMEGETNPFKLFRHDYLLHASNTWFLPKVFFEPYRKGLEDLVTMREVSRGSTKTSVDAAIRRMIQDWDQVTAKLLRQVIEYVKNPNDSTKENLKGTLSILALSQHQEMRQNKMENPWNFVVSPFSKLQKAIKHGTLQQEKGNPQGTYNSPGLNKEEFDRQFEKYCEHILKMYAR